MEAVVGIISGHSLRITGFWKTDHIVTLDIFHFIAPAHVL